MRTISLFSLLAALAVLGGCSPEQPAPPESATKPAAPAITAQAPAPVDAPPAYDASLAPNASPAAPAMATAGGPLTGAPMLGGAGGDADPYAPLSKTPELDKAIAEAQKSGNKKALAEAYIKRGTFRMKEDDKAGQRVKYRAALSDYRNAVTADPSNPAGAAGQKVIEDIYTSMGRPVPSVEEADAVSRTGTFKPTDTGAPLK